MTEKEKQWLEHVRQEYGGMILYSIENYYKLRDEVPDLFNEQRTNQENRRERARDLHQHNRTH